MNRDLIRNHVASFGHNAQLVDGGSKLTVKFVVLGQTITLTHTFPEELLRPPIFHLVGGHDFGKLAHVLTNENSDSGEVCIADASSTAVNTDRPEFAYRDTIDCHVQLLTQLIENPEYNQTEQLREFGAHWDILCRNEVDGTNEIFVIWDGNESNDLQVRLPHEETGTDLRTRPIALTFVNDPQSILIRNSSGWQTRPTVGKSLAIRLNCLDSVPVSRDNLLTWYFEIIDQMDGTGCHKLRRLYKQKIYDGWLVFSASIPDGETMFAIRWQTCSSKPKSLPSSTTQAEAENWTVTPYKVRSLSRESLVSRGGGSLGLGNKSVLLVGCGSVGSELALRLISSGVGHLTLSDPDALSEENLYRHTLSMNDIGRLKTEALADEIIAKHPWIEIECWNKCLEQMRELETLEKFDLIAIAIGTPTIERVFAEYCGQELIDIPILNCWLEGYGVGGHAIMIVPKTKGCWHCAYVDPSTLARGLTSNLNFLEPGQTVMKDHGGCGTQFLPYSGISAGYTASIAAELSVRFLEGKITKSSKISWKGCDMEARQASLATTWRYQNFSESLCILPLHNKNCDLCGV